MDAPFFTAPDGLVEIFVKQRTALRFPQHDYPIVCLLLKSKRFTRVRERQDGERGLDVLLTNEELRHLFEALLQVDPHFHRVLQGEDKTKDPQRKAFWDCLNYWRHH